MRLIGTGELARRAGATYRQVDYWARKGLLREAQPAMGSGSKRLFNPQEEDRTRALAAVSYASGDARHAQGGAHAWWLLEAIASGPAEGPWVVERGGVRITIEIDGPR